MNSGWAARIAWSLAVLAAAAMIGALWCMTLEWTAAPAYRYVQWTPGGSIGFIAPVLSSVIVGALIVSRHPAHRIGWLFIVIGLALSFQTFGEEYAIHFTRPGTFEAPAIPELAWISVWILSSLFIVYALLFLLFPNGHLRSRRWLPIAILAGVGLGCEFALRLVPGHFEMGSNLDRLPVENPFGIGLFRGTDLGFQITVLLTSYVTLVAGLVALVARFRAARGVEREQLKWFAFGASLVVASFAAGIVIWSATAVPDILWTYLFLLSLTALAVTSGIAILRHNLYDIAVIVNRALVYGALTVTLAVIYLFAVVGIGWLVRAISGVNSDLVTAGSTLIVAALFRPLRSHIQLVVDHRFYRQKYDAARTVAAFSTRLRDEIDLDVLSSELLAVIHNTMQPEFAGVWIRPSREPARQ